MSDEGRTAYPYKAGYWSSHQQLPRLVRPGERVLDVGCGEGFIASALRARGCEVVGIDHHISSAAAASCARTYAHDLEQGLALDHEPPFQAILLGDVLEHVQAHDQLLDHCHQRLQPGGRLVVSTANVAHLVIRLQLLFGRFEYASRGILDRTHVVLFTLRSISRLLERHRFRILEVRVTPLPAEALAPHAPHRWWVRALNAIQYALARCWKTLFAFQFILIAEPVSVR